MMFQNAIKIYKIKFIILKYMNQRRCHGCDRSTSSLLTANCGHRTCFYCIRDNRSANKCRRCYQNAQGNSTNVSPAKNKSATKYQHMKSYQNKNTGSYSPINQTSEKKKGHKRDESLATVSKSHGKSANELLVCPEHREPFTMFCKHSKEILCSMCLCRKPKYKEELMPLKNAEEFLRKQNKVFREEARMALSDVEHAWRIVNRNRQVFEQSIDTHKQFITNYFDDIIRKLREVQMNSIQYCQEYLKAKINEYGEISDDLGYLSETLKDFRQNVGENNTLNEQTFLYTSFNVIKKTLATLTFDYVSYEDMPLNLVNFNEQLAKKIESEMIGFRLNLHIKQSQKSKSRSTSLKSVSNNKQYSASPDAVKNKHKISIQNSIGIKKHKFSLCSNNSVDYSNQQNNLYKKLLKARYKV